MKIAKCKIGSGFIYSPEIHPVTHKTIRYVKWETRYSIAPVERYIFVKNLHKPKILTIFAKWLFGIKHLFD